MDTANGLSINAAIGWGILVMILVAGTDVPILQRPAAMLAWLFFLSVLFKFGPSAFATISSLNTTPVISGGGGGVKKP